MSDTVQERLARIEERVNSILSAVESGDERLKDQLISLIQKSDDMGHRLGSRVDRQDELIAANTRDIAENRREFEKYRNRIIGAVIATGGLTGGSVFGLIQLFGG